MNKWRNGLYGLVCIMFINTPIAQASETPPPWVQAGWDQISQQRTQQAINEWQQGLNAQADTRLFAVLGVFQELDNAIRQLKQIGRSQLAFMIVSHTSNSPAYYVLSARTVNPDKEMRQQELADLKQAAGIDRKLLAKWAVSFKDRSHQQVTATRQAQITTPVSKLTPAAQSVIESPAQTVAMHSNKTSIAPQQTTPPAPAVSHQTWKSRTIAPLWLEQGWQELKLKRIDRAMQIWQIGVNALADDQRFVSLGAFAKLDNAVTKLKDIGPEYRSFIAMRHSGKQLYYVLSLSAASSSHALDQAELSALQQAAGITSKLFSVAVINFRNHLILSHYPEMVALSTHKKATPHSSHEFKAMNNAPPIGHFEITGNQQVSTDAIILDLADFFDQPNAKPNHDRIKQRIETLYHDTGIDHVSINIPDAVADESVSIKILEDHR